MSALMLEQLDDAAQLAKTPCGDGTMPWRSWGDGPVLVLLHGGAGSWRHWVRNIAFLAQHYQVLAPDLPALGDAAMPPEPHTAESIAAIVAQGIEAILPRGTQYDLVGFSFGGVAAGDVALLHGARLRSLTIVGSGGLGLPRSPTELVKVRHLTGAEREAAHATNLARLMIADPAKIDALAIEIQDWNTRHSRLKTPEISRGDSLRAALGQISVPLNGIYGERDGPAWPNVPEREALFRRLRPDVAFHIVPGAGHWVSYEAADIFNTTLLAMLRRTESHAAPLS